MAKILLLLISCYQRLLSPLLGSQCRFSPTCSHYAYLSIEKHGAPKGFYYTVRRLLKCHPWHVGGHDPIP
ncbi:MAG: membrane protein insertion efficiency factor YidD [Burkholderiaceae bacterium]|nr:membrane protein insertion efficiency factor YidD [Burkholderiaceae bacterium]